MKKVLITGASGLIGGRLTEMLLAKGYSINTLGRQAGAAKKGNARAYTWDIENHKMDAAALDGVDALIHLAGAGVADKRWTSARKKEILDSRVNSTRLLFDTLKQVPNKVKTIVSASAVGYYGDCGDEIVTENHPVAKTFLAEVTRRWEAEVNKLEAIGIRHVCCRIGIVLAAHGGALPQLVKTLPLGVAGYFAKTPLYYPWVHIDDVCGIMIYGIENAEMQGSYNTTAPNPVTIRALMEAIVQAKHTRAIYTPVPPFALKLALGEMADMLLSSQKCSDEKIIKAGYAFNYPDLKKALANIYP